MREQDFFLVTDRSLAEVKKRIGLNDLTINMWPKRARVLSVGAGLNQKFEKGLKMIRPDLQIYSIDPTLGFDNPKIEVVLFDSETVVYTFDATNFARWANNKVIKGTEAIEFNLRRRRELQQSKLVNSVAVFAPRLPFKNESFDAVFDIHGPIQHMKDEVLKEFYLEELLRISKKTSTIFVSSLDRNQLAFLRRRNIIPEMSGTAEVPAYVIGR